jgi:two-component system, NtrC family, response regulator AtoC
MRDPIKILVVDDEPGLRDLLSFELGSRGYIVVTACDGLEATELAKKEKFDIMISDIMMPKMDGMGALDIIKGIDPTIEVIFATGFGSIEAGISAMKKGAVACIQKPYSLEEMEIIISHAVEKRKLKNEVKSMEAKLVKIYGLAESLAQTSLNPNQKKILDTLQEETAKFLQNLKSL